MIKDRTNQANRSEMQNGSSRTGKTLLTVAAIAAVIIICIAALGGIRMSHAGSNGNAEEASSTPTFSVPAFSGEPYVEINGNIPFFEEADYTTEAFERYSPLDQLGRCGAAYANVCRDLMPTEERGEIGSIKPTGWVQEKYEGIVDSKPPYLYNRCHLIAYCLTAENANEMNLITGTRYMNVKGMLPFEECVAKYLDQNDCHVLYRVTPIFEGDDLLASGVLMEAYSVEDSGAGICFCVYCYNVQPGVEIDYRTGESRAAESSGGVVDKVMY